VALWVRGRRPQDICVYTALVVVNAANTRTHARLLFIISTHNIHTNTSILTKISNDKRVWASVCCISLRFYRVIFMARDESCGNRLCEKPEKHEKHRKPPTSWTRRAIHFLFLCLKRPLCRTSYDSLY